MYSRRSSLGTGSSSLDGRQHTRLERGGEVEGSGKRLHGGSPWWVGPHLSHMLGRGVGGRERGTEGGSVELLGLQTCSTQERSIRRPGGGRGKEREGEGQRRRHRE